jgi:hypothetical protein
MHDLRQYRIGGSGAEHARQLFPQIPEEFENVQPSQPHEGAEHHQHEEGT